MKQKIRVLYLFLTLTTVCFITAAPTELLDIYIVDEDGKIEAIGKKVNENNIPSREKYIDIKEKYIFPGILLDYFSFGWVCFSWSCYFFYTI